MSYFVARAIRDSSSQLKPKATRTGVEPLREFDAATAGRGAFGRMYVAVGEVTENARAFAKEKAIRLLHDEELARLLVR